MQEQKPFRRTTPEEAGIPSGAVVRYLEALKRQRVCLHSFLLIRSGEIAYEANWKPMRPNDLHRMYSVSKSFVSVAIGFMQAEGRLSLDDRVADYFPERVTENTHPYAKMAKIRDLLRMASIHDEQPYNGAKDIDWAQCFFDVPPSHLPGTVHCYDTMGTVLCSMIVEKLSGQKLLDYLRPRLLDKIGFSKDAWCVETPTGASWAGSGIMCTPHDLAKFANVVMHGGVYEGEQLIPADYIKEATDYQISNMCNGCTIQEGYGYQFWRFPQNGFGCVGMGSQLAICLPERDLLFVTTGDTQELEQRQYAAYHLFYDLLLPEIKDDPMPVDNAAAEKLARMTSQLEIQTAPGYVDHELMERVSGKTYRMEKNAMGIDSVRFDFKDDIGSILWFNERGAHTLPFGLCRQVIGNFPEKHYSGRRISVPIGRGYKCATSAGFDSAGTLTMYCYIIDDYFGTLKMHFTFKEDTLTIMSAKVAEWFLDEYVGFASGTLQR